ncbi:TPA: hypothetical protein N0F65_006679 [Lagenidium giganteum]|uniref:Uncharacterized protein n=1 Tax=Lagenidium giganteum TaxID=4803 RepID=A0AAV2Z3M4_9STRA|nr:TPA: hypothetical protein N0F65_006679 [Lagenidium giganteum]
MDSRSPNLVDLDSPRGPPPANYADAFAFDPFQAAATQSGVPTSATSATSQAPAVSVPAQPPAPIVPPSMIQSPPHSPRESPLSPTHVERQQLHFFVSCSDVEGSLLSSSSRSAQTIVRGALSMLSQNKSPRVKPAAEVSVEVQLSREMPLDESYVTSEAIAAALDQECYWSERRKSRNPHFSVGFNVSCAVNQYDRHVRFRVMIPDENSHSNKNSQMYGYVQTSFQEMYTIATSGNYAQKMTLPVYSTVQDGATLVIRFFNIAPQPHYLFQKRHNIFRSFLFFPLMREDQEQTQAAGAKLAIEEAAEVDYSVKIPVQLLKVCQTELAAQCDEWKERYNFNRKRNRHFEDDAEALGFAHDVYRIQVICGRNLVGRASASSASSDSIVNGNKASTAFSITGAKGAAIMSRLKNQAGKLAGSGQSGSNSGASSHSEYVPPAVIGASEVARPSATQGRGSETSAGVNAFVVAKYTDGANGPQEFLVGRTNTEYESANPVWSSNKNLANCPHAKPMTKFFVSPSLPSRIDVSPVNSLKQFMFFRPSTMQNGQDLNGWLRFEVFNETYGYMSGLENELIGEVLIPLQSLREAMTVEERTVLPSEEHPDLPNGGAVRFMSLTLVDWFDVRSPVTDDVCGQIQLRINVLLANPTASASASSCESTEPRRQRLQADCVTGSTNPIYNELPLNFLYPHVLNLQKHMTEVTAMIDLCENLIEQKKTFKSSMHKKRADIQGIATNLHVSYFRIARNLSSQQAGSQVAAGISCPPAARVNHQASTEDLLGLGFSNNSNSTTVPAQSTPSNPPLAPPRPVLCEVHPTVTCGAPTAHAMGLSEYGLREMELEIHRLEGLLQKCTPRIMTRSNDTSAVVSEDSTDYVFGSLPDDGEESEDDSFSGGAVTPPRVSIEGSVSPSGSDHSAMPKKSNKYSNMAARAVAGARAKASKKMPSRGAKKSKDRYDSDDSGTFMVVEAKYPTIKLDPDEGVDPTTSINYAVRIFCRLEMLRAEYYLRKSVSVSQSVSALVTCFVSKLDMCLQEGNMNALEQMAKIGFLIGWESLISSQGKELRMLSDAWVAIKCLETFAFQLHESSNPDVVLEKREQAGYVIRIPVPPNAFALLPDSLRHDQLIAITSVLFTQGINEMQSLANIVGGSGVSFQSKINSSSFRTIVEYYNHFTTCGFAQPESTVGSHPDEILRNLRVSVETENSSSKNTCILFHAGDAVRSLNGGRVTYCKSGKDRTAMSVTLEQARLLVQRKRHVLQEIEAGNGGSDYGPLEEVKDVANTMREYGVRIEIARKNVGRLKYSFNSIQRKLLPEIYRPPMSTIQDIVTSVTARDS